MKISEVIHWNPLDPIPPEDRADLQPYSGETVLISYRHRIFEAAFLKESDYDFDKAFARENNLKSYWIGVHSLKHPVGLGSPDGLAKSKAYWAPLPSPKNMEENIIGLSTALTCGFITDRTVLIEGPDWIEAFYQPDNDSWMDVFGYVTPHTREIRGLVVNLPKSGISDLSKINGPVQPVWV